MTAHDRYLHLRPMDTQYTSYSSAFARSGVCEEFADSYIDSIEADNKIKLTADQKEIADLMVKMYDDKIAHTMAARKGERKSRGMWCIYIGGPKGTGKTMLGSSLLNYVNSFRYFSMDSTSFYVTLSRLSFETRGTFDHRGIAEEDVIDKYVYSPYLVIDEIRTPIKDYDKELLQNILLEREANYSPTILIGNIAPKGLNDIFDDYILDRMKRNGHMDTLVSDSWRTAGEETRA